MKKILVIPSLKPNEKLPALLREIIAAGYISSVQSGVITGSDEVEARESDTEKEISTVVMNSEVTENNRDLKGIMDAILIVDDGSGPDYASFFEECKSLGCTVLTHEVNKGKGAALKYAASYIMETYGWDCGMITADADGQHRPHDIARVARDMEAHPEALILGTRELKKENTPKKSWWGNRCTSIFFRLTCGKWVPDTQTGLRGIPPLLMPLSATEEGDRYEYEMNILMDASLDVPFHMTIIDTVYEDDNKGSHFRPLRDGVRVYGRFIKFLLSSVTGFFVDIILFSVLIAALPAAVDAWSEYLPAVLQATATGAASAGRIVTAAFVARICSGIVNFLFNKYVTFNSKERSSSEAVKYFILFVCQMMASAFFTSLFNKVLNAATGAKIIVDLILFFISYRIQRVWVFRKKIMA